MTVFMKLMFWWNIFVHDILYCNILKPYRINYLIFVLLFQILVRGGAISYFTNFLMERSFILKKSLFSSRTCGYAPSWLKGRSTDSSRIICHSFIKMEEAQHWLCTALIMGVLEPKKYMTTSINCRPRFWEDLLTQYSWQTSRQGWSSWVRSINTLFIFLLGWEVILESGKK